MRRIHCGITLLILLVLGTATQAQERGDGKASPTQKDPSGILTGRDGYSAGPAGGTNPWFNKNMRYAQDASDGPQQFVKGISDLGIKLGGDMQQMQHSPFGGQLSPGIIGGIYLRRFWRITALKVEALVNSAKYTSTQPAAEYATNHPSDSTAKSIFKSVYLSIPALAELKVYHTIYLEVGPQYSYLLTYKDKNDAFTKIYGHNDIFHPSEFSGVLGAEMTINSKLKAEIRYVKGLTDVNNSVYPKAYLQWNVNSIQAMVSYKL